MIDESRFQKSMWAPSQWVAVAILPEEVEVEGLWVSSRVPCEMMRVKTERGISRFGKGTSVIRKKMDSITAEVASVDSLAPGDRIARLVMEDTFEFWSFEKVLEVVVEDVVQAKRLSSPTSGLLFAGQDKWVLPLGPCVEIFRIRGKYPCRLVFPSSLVENPEELVDPAFWNLSWEEKP